MPAKARLLVSRSVQQMRIVRFVCFIMFSREMAIMLWTVKHGGIWKVEKPCKLPIV